jgi:hypothetical protein
MWMQFDQFAKSLLDTLLRPVGTVRSQHEVRSTAQAVDLWFEPEPGRAAERARLGPLARVSEEACMLEPFHQAPGLQEVRACIRKQYNLAHWQEQEARGAQKAKAAQESEAAQEPGTATAEGAFPRLWIISAGRPETVLARYEMRRMDTDREGDGDGGDGDGDGWLQGFWQAADGHALHVVVLRELPETLDTLLLRLLGAGRTHKRAVMELGALPRDSWQYELAMPLLLAFRIQVPPGLYDDSEDDMKYTETLERLYAEWEQRVRERGLKALRNSVINLYQARFGSMPEDLRVALTRIMDEERLEALVTVTGTRTPEDVTTAFREAASAS